MHYYVIITYFLDFNLLLAGLRGSIGDRIFEIYWCKNKSDIFCLGFYFWDNLHDNHSSNVTEMTIWTLIYLWYQISFLFIDSEKSFISECISSSIECTLGYMCSAITIFIVPQKSGNSFFVVVRKKFFYTLEQYCTRSSTW